MLTAFFTVSIFLENLEKYGSFVWNFFWSTFSELNSSVTGSFNNPGIYKHLFGKS